MNAPSRSALISSLRFLSRVFFALAVLTFAFGDFVFRAYTGADVMLGVLVAVGLALLFGGLALMAKIAIDRIEEQSLTGPRSLGEALRK
jgi:hypothetical protein